MRIQTRRVWRGPGQSPVLLLQSSPRFRAWAARFPLTRPIARLRTRALFDLAAGFVYSQVLAAFVALDLASRLLNAPSDATGLAPALGLSEPATERILAAAAALGLARQQPGGRYGLGPLGAALVDNPGVLAMIAHHDRLYEDLRDPVALLRDRGRTALGDYWRYDPGRDARPETMSPYSALMDASQAMIAAEALDAYDVARHRRVLDVGGGWGAFLLEAGRRAPHLERALFDLPAVADAARARLAGTGIAVVGGDFHTGPLPAGADLISLVRVLHDHDDGAALGLLRRVRRALASGGRLLIAEPMAGTRGAEPAGDAYFGMYLFAMGTGRPRTPRRLRAMLRAAGFAQARLLPTATPLLARVMVAQ